MSEEHLSLYSHPSEVTYWIGRQSIFV